MKSKTFIAKLANLHQMLEFIRAYSTSKQFHPDTISKIILAAEEALVNVIKYSYPESEGYVKITCKDPIKKAGITILIKDDGVPFNPISRSGIKKDDPPPIPSLDEGGRKGGYGIYIFVGVMDRVDYKRFDDGNLLAMTKYLEGV